MIRCAAIPLIATVLCAIFALEATSAQTADPDTEVVILSQPADGTDTAQIEQSIAAQLADLDITTHFHRTTEFPEEQTEPDELAAALIRSHDAAAAFIISPGTTHTLTIVTRFGDRIEKQRREVDVTSGMPLDEAFAIIVRAAVVTLLKRHRSSENADSRPSPESGEPPRPQAAPPPQPQEDAPSHSAEGHEQYRLFVEAGGALGIYASGVRPWGGMAFGLGWRPVRHFYLQTGYIAFAEVNHSAQQVSLTLKRHPFYIGASYLRSRRRLIFGGGASIIIDYVTDHISSPRDDATVARNGDELYAALSPYLHFGVRILAPLCLYLKLGAEIPLVSKTYGIADLEEEIPIIEPLPVQFVANLGLRVHFF